jgi:hypothetical protein
MSAVLTGLLLVVPFYLAVLLLLKAMGSLVRLPLGADCGT